MYGDDNLISKNDVRNKLDSILDMEYHYIFDAMKNISFPLDKDKEQELLKLQVAYIQLNRIHKMIYDSFNFERR